MRKLFHGSAVLVLALLLGACGHAPETDPAPPVVGVVTAQPTSVALTRNLVGRLSAYRSADVRARVAGVLLKRDYKEGSEVKQGQLLFQIDPAPLQAALDSARAQLAQAEATYTNNRVNADRARAVAPQGYISKSDLDNAIAAERTAKAAVQAARAAVETARINLGYAHVTAPIAGRVGEQQVTEGALVGEGTTTLLTTIDQLDPLYVNFTLSTRELDELRQAQQAGGVTLSRPGTATVKVALPDGTPYPEVGTVDFSSPSVDPATGSVNVRALLPNPKFTLLPGAYVKLQLNLGERHHVFLVPQAAVQHDITGAYVLVVGQGDTVNHRNVTTDGTHGLDWLVTAGLAAGDRIIVSGIQAAQVGKRAKPETWQAPAAPPAPAGAAATSATDGD